MKKVFLILFSFVALFGFSACGKKKEYDIVNPDLTNYNIEIEFDATSKKAECSMVLDYVNDTETVLSYLCFNLYPKYFMEGYTDKVVSNTKLNQAYPNGMSYADFNLNRVMVENRDVEIKYANQDQTILQVDLNKNLVPDTRIEVLVDFDFVLPNCCHRFGYGENTINLANFYPILCVYEDGGYKMNEYNSNGDPFYSEIANYDVKLIVDEEFVVAGTGEKTANKRDGKLQYIFKACSVRDFALVLSDKFNVVKETWEGIKIEYYYFEDKEANQSLKAGVDAIKTFSKLFGKYPYSTYSIVETDFVYGGMEYPNLVMISTAIDNADDYKNVIVHETAHQWWYGVVGNNEFELPWLDEALTEFSTVLFYDYNDGYKLNHKEMIKASQENYSLFVSVYQDVLGDIDTSMRPIDEYNTEPEYTYCIYVKGVLMYESLYQLIGEKDFIESLKYYYKSNMLKNVEVNDIVSAFEKISNQDLKNFFSSWQSDKVVIK